MELSRDLNILPPIEKLRMDVVFDDEKMAKDFEKYFKSKKEVRKTEVSKMMNYRYRLVVEMEKNFAEAKVIPAIGKLINNKNFVCLCLTDLQKTLTT